MTEMIEVFIVETGDRAEAETPEAAIRAAQVLVAEARDNGCGIRPTAQFFVDGEMVRERKGAISR